MVSVVEIDVTTVSAKLIWQFSKDTLSGFRANPRESRARDRTH
jgi:hypothetical protein